MQGSFPTADATRSQSFQATKYPLCAFRALAALVHDIGEEFGGRLNESRSICLQRIRLIDMRERIDKGLSGLIVQFLD